MSLMAKVNTLKSSLFVMMGKIRLSIWALRYLGVRWYIYRIYYALARKFELFRIKCPITDWPDDLSTAGIGPERLSWPTLKLEIDSPTFFNFDSKSECNSNPVDEGDRILIGCFQFYSYHWINAGFPPNWKKNYFTGQIVNDLRHWSFIDDFSQGDIKHIWELSRFDWAFPLMRAFLRTGQNKYAEGFWALLQDWMRHNRPNQGPNWKCGQEVALRIRVVFFAYIVFRDLFWEDQEKLGQLAVFLHVSALRIEKNLAYALSQNSNHGHTELLGLMIAGLVFRDYTEGRRWLKIFQKHTPHVVKTLNFKSGGCCMYSMNYNRMMLDCMILMITVSRIYDYKLPSILHERMQQAADFIYELIDLEDGCVPFFGSNDGACILPLTSCAYHDFRPLLQSLFWITGDQRSLGEGPWNEVLIFFDPEKKAIDDHSTCPLPARKDFHDASDSGYVSVRKGALQLCIRVGPQKFRPGHLNHLALLMKWRGKEILVDPGTYGYNAEAPFDHLFKDTHLQNTAFVEGFSQMKMVGRFLSLPWLGSELKSVTSDRIDLEFRGYPEVPGGIRHQRSIHWDTSKVVVKDRIESKVELKHGVHWLIADSEKEKCKLPNGGLRFPDLGIEVSVSGPSDIQCYQKDTNGQWGYRSRYYNQLEAANSVVMLSSLTHRSNFETVFNLF